MSVANESTVNGEQVGDDEVGSGSAFGHCKKFFLH